MGVRFKLLDLKQKEFLNRVGWFFRYEGDAMPCRAALFDPDRWGQRDEAIIAEKDAEILGIVTLASNGLQNSGRPTLDTLYVRKSHRKTGLGYGLFEQGLRRLIERGATYRVFCQLQSSVMVRLVVKLPDDLKGRLEAYEAFQSEDLAEFFDMP
jgi:GNAT superfamily N-acetyltransferase